MLTTILPYNVFKYNIFLHISQTEKHLPHRLWKWGCHHLLYSLVMAQVGESRGHNCRTHHYAMSAIV